ncbi:MAG: hypothetical protein N2487_01490 [Verrucomicrobiae bacterium]|nr:hypothetical protein [Verrucomicrobiae bacterium]
MKKVSHPMVGNGISLTHVGMDKLYLIFAMWNGIFNIEQGLQMCN